MNLKSIKYFFILFIFVFQSCKETPVSFDQFDNITFGFFAGYVANDIYSHIFKYENGKLYMDTLHSYISYNQRYSPKWVRMNDSLLKYINARLNEIPSELLSSKDTVFGIPDARDQGGYYLQVQRADGTDRFWLIDSDTNILPSYLVPYIENLRDIIRKLY